MNICSVSPVMWKFCTKFERNREICGRVIVTSIFDLMTLNMCYVLHSALG